MLKTRPSLPLCKCFLHRRSGTTPRHSSIALYYIMMHPPPFIIATVKGGVHNFPLGCSHDKALCLTRKNDFREKKSRWYAQILSPFNPLGLQSRFGDNWRQITLNLSGLSPKRDWSSKRVKTRRPPFVQDFFLFFLKDDLVRRPLHRVDGTHLSGTRVNPDVSRFEPSRTVTGGTYFFSGCSR